MALQEIPYGSDPEAASEALRQDGAAIITGVLNDAALASVREELAPFIERTPMGSDDFTGRKTQRTGALVARCPKVRPLVTNPTVIGAAQSFLAPFTEKIILHLTQTIYIHPGQGKQPLHRDRLAWGDHIPLNIEPQFNTIWALTDFSAENGATRVVPGSHTWDWERRADGDEVTQAEMAAGSLLVYSGSVLHSGGENRANESRLGLNITYCLGWLRQEENQYLSCPPHIAKDLDPGLQELLGYTQGNYALGYYSDPDSEEPNRDVLPPEMALGRMPRKGSGPSLSELVEQGVDVEQFGDQV